MKFRASKKYFNIRDARLDDSEILSNLQWEYLEQFSILDSPKTAENYRNAIGGSLLRGDGFLVAENDSKEVIGFVEQKKQNTQYVKIGYPYVSLTYPKRKDIQFHLVNQMLQRMKEIGVSLVTTEITDNFDEAFDLFASLGFRNPKTIFQSWEGYIKPINHLDISPFEIRRVKRKDLNITYSWIEKQLDKLSPIYISKADYNALLHSPKALRNGWALATYNEKPVAMINSLYNIKDKSIAIFGPYCQDGYENVRIPLLNELYLYFRLRGYKKARILRINLFDNDEELLNLFNFVKIEEVKLMSKYLD